MPTEKYAHAPEILEHSQRIGKQFGLYDNALFHTEVTDLEWDDERLALDRPHQPGRRVHRPVRRHGHRTAARAEAPGHPGHRGLPRALVPHQPLGLRLHRRRPVGRADGQAGRQAGGDHRHRRHRGAVHPAPRQGVRGALRVPAHAVVGRRARQPAHRPRVVRRDRHARAGSSAGSRTSPPTRPAGDARGGPRAGRLDRPGPPHPRPDHGAAARGLHAREHDGGVRGLRLREDERDPGPGRLDRRRTRRRPRSSRPGTASSASGRASTTSTCRRSTSPAPTSSTPTARASSASPRRRRRRRRRVRGRLHHLRVGLRGRHRVHPAGRLRHDRARRA